VGLITALRAFAKTQWRTALHREGSVTNCLQKTTQIMLCEASGTVQGGSGCNASAIRVWLWITKAVPTTLP